MLSNSQRKLILCRSLSLFCRLNDPNMRVVEILDRSCTPGNTCGTCRGDCMQDSDCANWQREANKCALPAIGGGWMVPSISASPIDYIPGCKGTPVAGKGYCYNPNKSSADRNDVTDQCLNKKASSDYGICCELPTSYTQCDAPEFSSGGMVYYCSQFNAAVVPPVDPPTDRPTERPVDSGGTPSASCRSVSGVNAIVGSFCGKTYADICCSCSPPTLPVATDCASNGCPNFGEGCFQAITVPCPDIQC